MTLNEIMRRLRSANRRMAMRALLALIVATGLMMAQTGGVLP